MEKNFVIYSTGENNKESLYKHMSRNTLFSNYSFSKILGTMVFLYAW